MKTSTYNFALFPFSILMLVTICCLSANVSNAEPTVEERFKELLKLILAKDDYKIHDILKSEDLDLEYQRVKISFTKVAQLLREIEEKFVENLATTCAEPQNWKVIFGMLHGNFRSITERKWHIDSPNITKEYAQLAQLLISFGAQMSFAIGEQAFKQSNVGLGTEKLEQFIHVSKCLDEKIEGIWGAEATRPFISATFIVDNKQQVLDIKFNQNDDAHIDKTQRRFSNFELFSVLVNHEKEEVSLLLKIIKEIVETGNYHFNGNSELTRMDHLLMAWAGVTDPQNYATNGNVSFLLKRFAHGLAQRLLESQALADGYFQLHSNEKIALMSYSKVLEGKLKELTEAANYKPPVEAIFHYEDAFKFVTVLDSREITFCIFNKQIKRLLAGYVNANDKEKIEKALERSESVVTVELPISNLVHLLKKIASDFAEPMLDKFREELTEFKVVFKPPFNALISDKEQLRLQKLIKFRIEEGKEKELWKKAVMQTLKMLLSFFIQMGYTVGSRAMELENGELSQLLKADSYLRQFEKGQDIPLAVKSVYLEAQFEYVEQAENLTLKFGLGSNEEENTNREENFKMLEYVSKMEKRTMENTIALIEFIDKGPPNESSHLESVILTDLESVISTDIKHMLRPWSESEDESEFPGKAAFYLLKRFGRDLGQRLLESKQLQQGYFRLFPNAVGKLQGMVNSMEKDTKEYRQKLNEEDLKRLQFRPYLHFEELIPVEFGLKEFLQEVKNWVKLLDGIKKQTCAEIILRIFKDRQVLFEESDMYNVTSNEFAVALVAFMPASLVAKVEEHAEEEIEYRKLKEEMSFLSSIKMKNRKNRKLAGLREDCMKVNAPLVRNQLKAIVNAITTLEQRTATCGRQIC